MVLNIRLKTLTIEYAKSDRLICATICCIPQQLLGWLAPKNGGKKWCDPIYHIGTQYSQYLFACCRQADQQLVLLCQVKLVLSTSSHYGHSWRLTRCPTHYVPPPLIGVVSQVWHDCRRFVLLHGRTVAFATDGLIVGLIGWAVKAMRRSDQPSPPVCVPWFSPWYQDRANHTCSQPQSC